MAENKVRLIRLIRSLVDSEQVTDSNNKLGVLRRIVSSTVNVASTVIRFSVIKKTVNEIINIGSKLFQNDIFQNNVFQLKINEANPILTLLKTVNKSVQIASDIKKSLGLGKIINNAISVAESKVKQMVLIKSISEAISVQSFRNKLEVIEGIDHLVHLKIHITHLIFVIILECLEIYTGRIRSFCFTRANSVCCWISTNISNRYG